MDSERWIARFSDLVHTVWRQANTSSFLRVHCDGSGYGRRLSYRGTGAEFIAAGLGHVKPSSAVYVAIQLEV
ncbi:MAG: hypothetical protein JWP44_4941 [Mucilaginibacter sp.]|nr:hypothetical protein [Mucilaginibacter sp.]